MEKYSSYFYDNIDDFYSFVSGKDYSTEANTPFQYEQWQRLLYREHKALRFGTPYLGVV